MLHADQMPIPHIAAARQGGGSWVVLIGERMYKEGSPHTRQESTLPAILFEIALG
jgi:hypothetical protein